MTLIDRWFDVKFGIISCDMWLQPCWCLIRNSKRIFFYIWVLYKLLNGFSAACMLQKVPVHLASGVHFFLWLKSVVTFWIRQHFFTCPSGTSKVSQTMSLSQSLATICFFCGYCGCLSGIMSLVMWNGFRLLEIAEEYEENGTKETCLLVDYDKMECTYDCNCDSDDCSTCYGHQYRYTATVESKCGNETLFQREDEIDCPGDFIVMNTEKTCYVLECEEEEFSFASSSDYSKTAIIYFVVAGIAGCPILLCICTCISAVISGVLEACCGIKCCFQ